MTQRIAIYTDVAYRAQRQDGTIPLCTMLFPFLDKDPVPPWWEGHSIFDAYHRNASDYFQLVDDIHLADFVVLPCPYFDYIHNNNQHIAHEFAQVAAQAQKTLIVFDKGDYDLKFPAENVVHFNTAIEKRDKNQFGLPGWVPDYTLKYDITPHAKAEKPRASFCGRVIRPTIKTRAVQLVRMYVPIVKDERIGRASNTRMDVSERYRYRFTRHQALELLQADPRIETDFIVRDQFFAGIQSNKKWDTNAVEKANREYTENIIANDYVVCARGSGNFSFRFYETLACMRMPIFLNTHCTLPYDFVINWPNEILWLEADHVHRLPDALVAFHEAMTPEQFLERQRRFRHLYEEWISPDGFFRNFYRHLEHFPA